MHTLSVGKPIDYIIVVIYFIGIFGFGSLFARFTKTTRDFFFGSQRFSWWLIAMSCIATTVGSYSFVKYSSVGFKYGLSSTMTYLNDWIELPLLLLGWFPIIYFSRVASVPEYFERRFGKSARLGATAIILIYMIGYIGINLLTMGKVINAIFGIPLIHSAVLVAFVCAVYVTAGGQTAVIMTDFMQALMLLIAGVAIFVIGLCVLGGWNEFWNALPIHHRLPFAAFNKPDEFNYIGVFWQDGVANNLAYYFINQGFILRLLSLKSAREVKKTFIFLPLVLMPLAAFATANAGWIGSAMVGKGLLPSNIDPDKIFIVVVEKLSVPGVFGFMIAALTAALMSTVDTLINAVATVFVNDVYAPYVVKGREDRHYLFVARVASVVASIVGILLVPVFSSFRSIYEAHAAFIATVTPPMVVAVVLGVFWPRYSKMAAISTMLLGSAAVGISIKYPRLIDIFSFGVDVPGRYSYMRALYGLVVSFVVAVVATLCTEAPEPSDVAGLVVGTLDKAKWRYKDGAPKETYGKGFIGVMNERDGISGASLSKKVMEELKADLGDLVYIEDARRWLGGLRSVHTKITNMHEDEMVPIYLPPALIKDGSLIAGRLHKVELIM
jgi:SSS family solute:Na+ symporter